MRTLFALLVIAVVAGLGVAWARNHAATAIHHVIDTSLPDEVQGTWVPERHGRAVRRARIRFEGGGVTSVRCRARIGTYSVHIDHHFGFSKAPGRHGPRCPDRLLGKALSRASRVDVDSDGRLVLSDSDGHDVATFEPSRR